MKTQQDEILSSIKDLCSCLCDTDLERLGAEEELLMRYIKRPSIGLDRKHKAFLRLAEINKEQLKIIGHKA